MFVQAALLAQDYCDAIDLNLGCPQMIAKRGRNTNLRPFFVQVEQTNLFFRKAIMELSSKMNGSCWRKWVSLISVQDSGKKYTFRKQFYSCRATFAF